MTISAILAAILCATAPLAAGETQIQNTEQTESNFKLGSETISAIRADYDGGKYNDFLNEMDSAYTQAKEANELDGIIQMRQKEIPQGAQEKWESQFLSLQKEKNKELLSVVGEKDDSLFAQKVRSLAANLSTSDQEKAISKLNSFVQMAPGGGQNEDENTLINIDLEYEYKLLHALMPMSDLSDAQRFEYQNVLRMQKMDKMVEASSSFQDLSLKQAVGLAAANLDARLARNLDGADLNAFTKGKVKPSNELEEKVTSILSSYQEKFSDLMKQISNENK